MTTEKFALSPSRGFPNWLARVGGSLTFTTYQAGKVFFLGLRPDGQVSVFERTFPRAMGLAVSNSARTLHLATKYQIYRFDNVLKPGQTNGQFDSLYVPHQSWITGDVDAHDMGVDAKGRVIFANTLFNCLSTVSDGYSFKPLWTPPFISKIAAEDRCHLNGLAMMDGAAKYVTCVSRSDAVGGWRDRRADGGVVIDVQSNDIICEGLSMPHSPRVHNGRLYVLNSGTGEFGWVDVQSGRFNPIAFCPGYARGMTFVDKYAVIGLSEARKNKTFSGLALDDALKSRDVDARCGFIIVDLDTGDAVEWLKIDGVVTELFDVAHLRGTQCPSALGLIGSDIHSTFSIAPQ